MASDPHSAQVARRVWDAANVMRADADALAQDVAGLPITGRKLLPWIEVAAFALKQVRNLSFPFAFPGVPAPGEPGPETPPDGAADGVPHEC